MYFSLAVYSTSHFFVDFACAFLMFGGLRSAPDWLLCLLIYNFFAFAMQLPLGVFADRLNKNSIFASAGCFLVAAAYLMGFSSAAACLLLGLGNGMFHVGGGIDVINESHGRCGPLGVFVSPGALGLYLGTLLGRSGSLPLWLGAVTAILCGLFITLVQLHRGGTLKSENAPFALDGISKPVFFAAAALFAVVVLRSLMGMTYDFPGKSDAGLWAVIAVVSGKALGGILSDRFGMVFVSSASLITCGLLFLFPGFTIGALLALLLFNMTMPITLCAVSKLFPRAKGFAFGLLTFGLFAGFLPVFFSNGSLGLSPELMCAASIASLVFLLLGLRSVPK